MYPLFYHEPKRKLAVGVSKVGGEPDLPASIEWPDGLDDKGKKRGKAEFLAQFNLAELPPIKDPDLPRTGHLWLFVQNTLLTEAPNVIFYRDGKEPLKPRPKPQSTNPPTEYGWRDLKPASLTFQAGVSLPLSSSKFRRKFETLSNELDELHTLMTAGPDDEHETIDGQLGGYSFQAEVDLARQYAIEEMGKADFISADAWSSVEQLEGQIKNGLPFLKGDKLKAYQNELRKNLTPLKWIVKNDKEIQARADALQLLCMFRPNYGIDLEFGDGMYLDFLMHREDLAKRDFSNVYCNLPMLL
ncbi:MAG TPA: DUF1963 domain-containing protein [Humisphaera sp.]|jgi:hypothetical protein|nr:DUF1963 domain-containing protein [Humisphaera sp.]